MAKKVRLCGNCRAENPDEASCCVACGRRFQADDSATPSENVVAVSSPEHGHKRKSAKRAALELVAILIVVGMVTYVLFMSRWTDSDAQDDRFRMTILGLRLQGLVLAFAGVGTAILWSLRGSEFLMPDYRTKKDGARPSLFPGMERSLFLSGIVARRTDAAHERADIPFTVRVLLYLLAFLSPALGAIAGAVLLTDERPKYRVIGRRCLRIAAFILAIGALLLAPTHFSQS